MSGITLEFKLLEFDKPDKNGRVYSRELFNWLREQKSLMTTTPFTINGEVYDIECEITEVKEDDSKEIIGKLTHKNKEEE